MGIAVAIFYIPLYALFSWCAIYAARKTAKISLDDNTKGSKYRYIIFGFIFSTLLTWFFIWLVPVKGNTDFGAFFTQLSLTLLTPILLGVLLSILVKSIKSENKLSFVGFISGVYYSTIAIPWLTIVAASNYYNVVNFPKYYSLCNKAEIKFIETVKPAKSVFLSPDLFTNVSKGRQAETRSVGIFLLNQSTLEYIEKPSEYAGDAQYERVLTEGKRILRSKRGDKERTKYITQLIENISSEYIVISKRLNIPDEKSSGIGGSEIEVRRVSDDKLIAHARYYWDNKTFKSCPDEVHSGLFIYRFIATALNVINKESNIKGIQYK